VRIVYITQRLPFGTGETFIVPEVDALLAAGHELLIIPWMSRDPVMHDDVAALLPYTRTLPATLGLIAAVASEIARNPRRSLRTFWGLRRTRPRWRTPRNVLATAQGIWVGQIAKAWRAEHIHAHWATFTATLGMVASTVSGIPWSFTAHRYDIIRNNLLAEKLRSARFGRFIARDMLDLAHSLVGPDAMAQAFVLHMGVRLPPAPSWNTPARSTPIVLCPAQLIPRKGHVHLLESAARLSARGIAFELWLAGDGPESEAIARGVKQLGLGDRVRMLGLIPHAKLLQLYREGAVDCVALPSLHEGLSVALIEAMSYGVPVISTRTGGMAELLSGDAGILVPPANPAALATALERLLTSPLQREELGRAGRKRIEAEFDVVPIARELTRRFAAPDPVRPGK
jgi:colanic acid/amylovoran biosynthesis glycosyltransferase